LEKERGRIKGGRGENEEKNEIAREEARRKRDRGERVRRGEEMRGGGKEYRRIKILENSMEAKEREERRKRNCIIKGVKKEKGDWKWGVEKILREIDAEVKVEEMRRIYVGGEERGDMVWVKLEKEEDKRRLWSKKDFEGKENMD